VLGLDGSLPSDSGNLSNPLTLLVE